MSRREFQFQEGTSSKFWAIEVEGPRFTVQFGRLGTAGQSQTKEFGSDQEAQKATEKLIAEKTKKGYKEVAGAAPTPAAAPAPAAPVKAATKQKPPVIAPTASPPAATKLAVTRSLDLTPQDWLLATWRPRQPLPMPTIRAFDLKKALKRLQSIEVNQGCWLWTKIHLDPLLSPEEAHFWLVALTYNTAHNEKPEDAARKLAQQQFDGQLSLTEVVERIKEMGHTFQDNVRVLSELLPSLLSPEDLVTVAGGDELRDGMWLNYLLAERFLEHILPYLSAQEMEPLKSVLRNAVTPNKWSTSHSHYAPPAFRLAGALGMHAELEAVVSSWADNQYKGLYHRSPQCVVFGLGDAKKVSQQMRRLGLLLPTPEIARGWLAHTEYSGLDLLRDSILACTNKKDAEKLFEVFRLVKAPEAAPLMLALQLDSKVQNLAADWLAENLGNAIAGLIPVAAGKDKLAEAALQFLREAKKKGHADFIAAQLKSASADITGPVGAAVLEQEEKVYEPLDANTTPKPLKAVFAASAAASGLPAWCAPSLLPPILVGGRRLLDEQVSAVLAALRKTPLGTPEPLLDALKVHADRASLDAFVWSLFERWLGQGAPTKEKWAIFAIGHLGGDMSVLKLTPLVRAWPGESQHARAVLGLESLRAIGSDAALMQLNGIAQKLKFQALKAKAKEFMEAIAKDKGLTREELEDRIVPDLDLDERGSRVFDFGARQFRVALGPDLTPVVRDDEGKVKADLPKPGSKDDTEKATAAVADWKVLKKLLRDALKIQIPRLEQAMVTGRRWTPEQFETLLVRHPLMTHLASRVLWGGYDDKEKLRATFRVTEEQEYADADEKPFSLKGVATVGIVHPLHLTTEQRTKWGEVFGDYELITPFPQLSRTVLTPEVDEAKAKLLTRWAKIKVQPIVARGTLEKCGWTRGDLSDHGMIDEFYKHFPAANVTALVEVYPGIPIGMADWAEDQTIPRVFFLSELYKPIHYPSHKEDQFVALNKVDAVAVSEVLADLTALASKAK